MVLCDHGIHWLFAGRTETWIDFTLHYICSLFLFWHTYILCFLSVIFKNNCRLSQNHQAVNSEEKNRTKGTWKNLNMASLCVSIVTKPIMMWSGLSPSPLPSLSPFCTGPILWMSCFSACCVICSACGLTHHSNSALNTELLVFCWIFLLTLHCSI